MYRQLQLAQPCPCGADHFVYSSDLIRIPDPAESRWVLCHVTGKLYQLALRHVGWVNRLPDSASLIEWPPRTYHRVRTA